jgi:hypothetical protein
MKKIQTLSIQKNPSHFLFPVRALRTAEIEGTDEGELLGKQSFDSVEGLQRAIASFKAEFKRGKVLVEVDEMTVRSFRKSDMEWLFAHPATYRSSL